MNKHICGWSLERVESFLFLSSSLGEEGVGGCVFSTNWRYRCLSGPTFSLKCLDCFHVSRSMFFIICLGEGLFSVVWSQQSQRLVWGKWKAWGRVCQCFSFFSSLPCFSLCPQHRVRWAAFPGCPAQLFTPALLFPLSLFYLFSHSLPSTLSSWLYFWNICFFLSSPFSFNLPQHSRSRCHSFLSSLFTGPFLASIVGPQPPCPEQNTNVNSKMTACYCHFSIIYFCFLFQFSF